MSIKTSLACGSALGALAALALASGAQAQETTTSWKGAPQFANDSLTFKVRGRLYMDFVNQDVDRETGADFSSQVTRTRTARLGVEGTWNQNWAYKAEFQLVGGSAAWEDVILEYKPTDNASVMIGNFKTVSLENVTSSRYTTFMERGAYNDFIDAGRVMNLAAKFNGENWTALAALSGDSINNADPAVVGNDGGSESAAAAFRVTWAPVMTDTQTVHLGLWGRQRDRGDAAAFNYQVRNNTNYGARYTASGATGDSDRTIALEAAWLAGPFSLQGEWADTEIDRTNGLDQNAQAYYVAASWFVTGEKRNLEVKKGEFGRTKILNPTTAGGPGAVELAVRYDNVDLTDITGVATAGQYDAWTVGANWYPFPYVRFMANYSKSTNDNPAVGADVDADTLQFRAQFDF
ncbi:MAG: OprO/OprP family phosphate-selective porin [Pseudomonadota bacterium]